MRNRRARRLRQLGGVLLAGLIALAAVVAPQAAVQPASAADPTNDVIVRLSIDAVDIVNCLDEYIELGCGDADFYPVVHMNGGPELSKPKIEDDNHIEPTDWEFATGPIPYADGTSVEITIDIYDRDGAFRGDDDHADISPTVGDRTLRLQATMGTVPCPVNLPGTPDTQCGTATTTQGTEDEEAASISFHVDILSTASDADGDGLADDWEANGVTFNGQFVDLPAMGADPNKPDLFIHLDWMQDTTRDQRLNMAAVQLVVEAFRDSGYVSPTGSVGINLWVDQGPNSTLDFAANTTWGTLSRAQQIQWQRNIGALTPGGDYDWTAFQAFKDANFRPTGRGPIFHYAIAAFFQEAPAVGDPQNTSSGISRNPSGGGFDEGASDFLITLGNFSGGAGNTQQQAGTLMHEFGHNLGLMHGGNEHANYKANYPSIMSYIHQLGGIAVTGTGGLTLGNVDYSRGSLPAVDEHKLNEQGLGAAYAAFGSATRCPDPANPGDRQTVWVNSSNTPFDWDCDGTVEGGNVEYDANESGSVDDEINDHDDWSAIKFRVGAIGDVGDGDLDLPMSSPHEPSVTADNVAPTTTASLAGTLGTNGWYTSAVTVTLSAVDAGGSGVQQTQYRIGSGAWTRYAAPFAVTGEGGNVVAFRSMDNVGNEEAVQSVTIPIDTVAPVVTCSATPAAVWPPNHKLAAVATSVLVTDGGSGSAGFVLASATSNQPDNGTGDGDAAGDIQGFTLGVADTGGFLRAERAGSGGTRVYSLTYTGADQAGNTATCTTTVRVGG